MNVATREAVSALLVVLFANGRIALAAPSELQSLWNGPEGRPPPESISLRLRSDLPAVEVQIAKDECEPHISGRTLHWHGRYGTSGLGRMSLTYDADKKCVVGTVTTPDAQFYRLRGVFDGPLRVELVEPSKDSKENPLVGLQSARKDDQKPPSCKDKAADIRVLVAYTPNAQTAAGVPIECEIKDAIESTNCSFRKSGVKARLNLSSIRQIDYQEQGIGIDLVMLASDIDDFMPEIHDWRDKDNADIVVLITQDPYKQSGLSFQFKYNDINRNTFSRKAFGVVSEQGMLSPDYGFAHEIGHLLGAHHDYWSTNGDKGAVAPDKDYAHAHLQPFVASPCYPWKTIMGSSTYCYACRTVPRWSSSDPQVRWCGNATGNADYEDNARVINEVADTVAKLRCSN